MRVLVLFVALAITSFIVPTIIFRGSTDIIVAAVILAFFNACFKPVMIVLTLPINILSLGLFTFVINGLLLAFTAALVPGFFIAGFGSAIFGGIIISSVSVLVNLLS